MKAARVFVYTFFLATAMVSATFQTFAQEKGIAPSDGVDIHFTVYGEGDPLLVINGGPGFSSEGFSDLAGKLAERYRVILYDQRGTGLSVMPSVNRHNMTMDLMVTDMEALRKHLNISEWTIMGHSFGGIMANYYTARYPDHVLGLIHSSSGGVDLGLLQYFDIGNTLTPLEADSLAYWTARVNGGDTTAQADRKRRDFFAAAYVYHDRNIPVVAERLSQSNMEINRLIWSDLRRISYDISGELADFSKPVLIIQGRQDIIRPETGERARNLFPDARLVILENCGHYGWLDQPRDYFDHIFAFGKGT